MKHDYNQTRPMPIDPADVWEWKKEQVKAAVAEFPGEFTLKDPRVRGLRFRVSEMDSYWSDGYGSPMVYTEIWREAGDCGNKEAGWLSYAKATPAELRREMIKIEKPAGGQS